VLRLRIAGANYTTQRTDRLGNRGLDTLQGSLGGYSDSHRPVEAPPGKNSHALELLGLRAGASDAEISAAYRHLAQIYHPEKVAGLAPEFQALAERKMRGINAAYELLKGYNS
jgi:DnaJ-domain-containing protein 1